MFEHKEKPTTEVAPEEEKLGLLAVYLLGIPLCLGTDIAGDESSIIWGIEKEQGKEEEEEGEEQEGMEEEPAALSMVMNQMMEEDYDYPADVPMDQEDEHNDSSEPRSVEQSEESEDDSENAPTDMSGIPSAVLEALKLAKSDKAICVSTHCLIYVTTQLMNAPNSDIDSTSPLYSGLHQLLPRMLSLVPASPKYDSIRMALETLCDNEAKLDPTTETSELIPLVRELYHICLRIITIVRHEELKDLSVLLNTEEPFEMLCKRLFQCRPQKINVERNDDRSDEE